MSVRAELARLGLRWLMKPGTAQSPSRSSSQISSRSRGAAPAKRKSGREANSNSSATRCSNLS